MGEGGIVNQPLIFEASHDRSDTLFPEAAPDKPRPELGLAARAVVEIIRCRLEAALEIITLLKFTNLLSAQFLTDRQARREHHLRLQAQGKLAIEIYPNPAPVPAPGTESRNLLHRFPTPVSIKQKAKA
jgi:hypothetical protein